MSSIVVLGKAQSLEKLPDSYIVVYSSTSEELKLLNLQIVENILRKVMEEFELRLAKENEQVNLILKLYTFSFSIILFLVIFHDIDNAFAYKRLKLTELEGFLDNFFALIFFNSLDWLQEMWISQVPMSMKT